MLNMGAKEAPLLRNTGTLAQQLCRYLTDVEIGEYLHWEEPDISEDIKENLFALCSEFRDIFASTGNVGRLETVQHSIDTGTVAPIKSRPYRLSPGKRAVVRDAVAKMLEKGVIEHSNSPWSSPIVFVGKQNGEYRFCTDYRKLNAVTKKDSYPLPRIDDMLEKLKRANYFSTFDLASGYLKIPIYPLDKKKTAL